MKHRPVFAIILALAAINGLFAVVLGAYGAHGLRPQLDDKLWSAFNTASAYHFYHSLGLLGLAALAAYCRHRLWLWVASSWQLGIILFSGSIYALCLGAPKWLGPVTPVGGVSLIVGWALLFWAALGLRNSE